MNGPVTTRRAAVVAGAAGLAAALTACGSDSGSDGGDGGEEADRGEELGATGEIPVGGGKIYTDQQVVVTQPAEGDFVAFSSICTHQGCPVAEVSGGSINCTCHGTRFDIADGSVLEGPATTPLPQEAITVEGGTILRG
ncbi:Rieske (2Fe-2S) protein [Streptomyces profundus]|uniref:Rieske (2Fe-2S) protein n=1 Tax=Streptomyces profundus TaxID=2867410 RepID=UPI001D15FFDD|nr:Rieske (2Fe-2S) protein [Streptomyces sp. MA3_2.13]UED82865.1 Rieske (2Fe-2S) protein [Streptomyces sp. MA3_2.13]